VARQRYQGSQKDPGALGADLRREGSKYKTDYKLTKGSQKDAMKRFCVLLPMQEERTIASMAP